MAEKQLEKLNLNPEELNVGEIKLLEYDAVGRGFLELDDEDLSFFEKETWKLFVGTIGEKILKQQKEKIFGECMIQFFPAEREKLLESAKKNNKTFMMKTLLSPLFFITYDSNLNVEFVHKSEEEIPKKIFFLILCRR